MSVLVVAALLVFSATVPGIVASSGATADAQRAAISPTNADFADADPFVNTSQNVSVWERAGIPLRVDTSNAETTLEGPTTQVNFNDSGDAPINKDTIGVFETGQTISLELDNTIGANTDDFNGEDVQLVAARLDDDPDTSDQNQSEVMNLTTNEAIDRLLSQDRNATEINRNFTFTIADNGTIENGEFTGSFTPSEPGTYAFMLVASDSGEAVSVTDGNASLSEDARILGVDAAPVQAASAQATPQANTVSPGENVTFEVDSNLADEPTSHTVLLVNESVLAGQETTINIDGELDRNLTSENITIEHSIDAVDGVARIDAGSQVMGVDISEQSRSGTAGLPSLIEFLANETDQEAPNTDSTGDTVLNASVTSVVTDGNSTTLEVGTTKNWTNGTYTYIYVAGINDTDQYSTAEGEITVGEAESEREDVQLTLTANRTNVKVNESVRFTVTGPNGNRVSGAELEIGSATVPTRNGQATISFLTAANYTVTATKDATETKRFLSDSVEIVVTEADEEEPTGPPAGGGGGGGGQGGGDAAGEARGIATNTGATVNFRSTRGGQPLRVEVPNVASDRAAVTALELTTRFSESNFRVEFTKPQNAPPSGTPAVPSSKGTAVSYFTADAIGINNDEIDEVSFTFTLSEDQLGDRSPEDVRLFRYHDGEWMALETTHLGGNEFRARSPGFSAFAIGFVSQQEATATPTETATPTPADGTTPTETATQTATATATPEQPGGGGIGPLVIGIIILFVIGIGAVLYFRGDLDLSQLNQNR